MSKKKKKNKSPSTVRSSTMYMNRQANLLAIAMDEIERARRAEEYRQRKAKRDE